MRVGYAAGAFDLFHVGHLHLLRQAKAECDYLIAGVVTDELLIKNKGRAPIIPQQERWEIVQQIRYVDKAIIESLPHKIDTWRSVPFDIFFKGDDWRGTPKGLALERDFAAVGVSVVYFPYTVHTSSSTLRRTLELLNSSPVERPALLQKTH